MIQSAISRKSKFIGTFRSIRSFKIGLMVIEAQENHPNLSFDFIYIIICPNRVLSNFLTAVSCHSSVHTAKLKYSNIDWEEIKK